MLLITKYGLITKSRIKNKNSGMVWIGCWIWWSIT